MSTTSERPPDESSFQQMQASPEFTDLRARFRRFVFPMSAAFLIWYFVYVLLAAYQPEFMSTKLAGDLTVGLLIGVLQFVSTFAITTIYVRYATKNIDPRAAEIADELEGSGR